MAALSNTEAASLLNESLRSGTVYIGLFLTDPTAGATGQEANGGGYARKVITFGVPSNTIPSNFIRSTTPYAHYFGQDNVGKF